MSSRPQNRRRGSRQTSPDYEPPLSSSRPQSRHTSPKREYLNPQRYWERDNTVPYNNQNHQTQNYNLVNQPPRYHGGYTHHHSEGRAQKRDYREYQRPNHVSETSRRLTSVGADGTTVQVTSSSITHDGKEVYVKSSEEVRQDKLKELENEGINGNLEGPKRPNVLRLFITKVSPNTTEKKMEYYILQNFNNIGKVIVRKLDMVKSGYYASFIVQVITDADTKLDFEYFEDHDWPNGIKVFPGREPGEWYL